jgi:site-specific DNA-methyltransferase (adenine-specific)
MIIPSRWFAGGKGLDEFRDTMLKDKRITRLVDYPVATDVFPGVKVNGGICYFLWERDASGPCCVTTRMKNFEDTMSRPLDEFDTFVRFNKAIPILKKVISKQNHFLNKTVTSRKPFGLPTTVQPSGKGDLTLYAFRNVGKIPKSAITVGTEMLGLYKVLISMGYGEGGESREYPRMIMGKPIVAAPPSACTETYIVAGAFKKRTEAENLAAFLRTRFARFLLGLRKNTQHITKERFQFVPALPMTEVWTDRKLYEHFDITAEEIAFIETIVRPMEAEDD